MKLVFRTSVNPIDWLSPNPLAPSAAAAGAAAWVAPSPASSSPTASVSAAAEQHAASTAGESLVQQQAGASQQQQQQWLDQLPSPQQHQQQRTPAPPPYGRCVVIYKKGDDLRQDQFILQVRDKAAFFTRPYEPACCMCPMLCMHVLKAAMDLLAVSMHARHPPASNIHTLTVRPEPATLQAAPPQTPLTPVAAPPSAVPPNPLACAGR